MKCLMSAASKQRLSKRQKYKNNLALNSSWIWGFGDLGIPPLIRDYILIASFEIGIAIIFSPCQCQYKTVQRQKHYPAKISRTSKICGRLCLPLSGFIQHQPNIITNQGVSSSPHCKAGHFSGRTYIQGHRP